MEFRLTMIFLFLPASSINSSIEKIDAILVTHEHSDHIKGIKVFTKKHKARLHMTAGTYEALVKTDALDNAEECSIITPDGVDVGCMLIKPFATSHDASESCGYTIELANGRKMSVATDLGIMTDTVLENIKGSDLVMLESNHDVGMLQNGPYPFFLKQRILSNHGHLSNENAGRLLNRILTDKTKSIVLGHLSQENNHQHQVKTHQKLIYILPKNYR